MVRSIFAGLLLVTAVSAQDPVFKGVTTTETQAVLRYQAPDANPCTVQVSENSALTPLDHDVDPALFAGSSLDTRAGSAGAGEDRIFVAGKRSSELALDGNRYSRALQAATQHFYAITCSGHTIGGTFTTDNPPVGNESSDVPPFDLAAPFGNYGWPTINWGDQSVEYIDPFTGLQVKRITYPGEHGSLITSGNLTQPTGVEDGSTFYTFGTSCAGSKWSNPCAVLAADGNNAVYSGSGGDPLDVGFYKDGYHLGVAQPEMGGSE